jgi:hypothetical protein
MAEVRLTPWEREWAEHVANKRTEANLGKSNAAHYDESKLQDDYIADLAGAVCELAVAKRLNKYWDGSYWTEGQHSDFERRADVGTNTEVRRIRSRHYRLQVRAKEVREERIMVLAYAHEPHFVAVDVIGWGYACELWERGEPIEWDKSGNTRLVDQRWLHAL